MTVSPMSDNLNIIAALSDRPNATDGLTAAQLKAKYDQGPGLIKTYINSTLVPALNSALPDGQYAADAGSTDAYAVTLSPVPSAYYTGMVVRFKANTANTGAATLNVNALGAKTIKKKVSSDLNDSDILASQIVEVVYDGTNFQILSIITLKGEAWISPTLLNSWSNFGGTFATACYRKDEVGNVLTKGYIGGGVTTGGTTIFTFPAGYRPNEQHRLTTHGYNGTTQVIVVLSVDNTGALNIIQGNAATQISLDITPFRAEQ